MTEKLFETALGLSTPWYVAGVEFDGEARELIIRVDFTTGSRFAVSGVEGAHPVHDTMSKRYRHLNFFQYECQLEVRVPRVKLPDGAVRQVEPPWAGKLSGFTLLFEAKRKKEKGKRVRPELCVICQPLQQSSLLS